MNNNQVTHICTNCGYQGKPKTYTKGSIWIELLLWILFLFPGIIYSVWRLTTRSQVCPKCNASNMIPINTPKGQELLKK